MARKKSPDPTGSGVILVTGASRRIGRAIALDYAARGWKVAAHYRSGSEESRELLEEIRSRGGAARRYRADLTNPKAARRLAAAVASDLGPLRIVVASAAVFRKTPWRSLSVEDWDFHMNANLRSVFLLARACVPFMQEGASFITIGDWSALRPYRNFLPYCVSKAGVVALTKGLAQELAPRLRVNCVCPGTVLPPERASAEVIGRIRSRTPLGRIGSPKDILAAIRFLSEETDFATGSVLVVDGGRLVSDPGYG